MLILIETVEHFRADGETASPEDIVSNEYANHESVSNTWSIVISIVDANGYPYRFPDLKEKRAPNVSNVFSPSLLQPFGQAIFCRISSLTVWTISVKEVDV